jgi:hypothetical protein
MDKFEIIAQGNHAKRLLEDETLLEAFAAVEADIYNEWRTSPVGDDRARSDLFHTLKGLERLKTRLQAILDDGLIAKSRS